MHRFANTFNKVDFIFSPSTDDLYEILSSLPESVVYSCQPCMQAQPGEGQEKEPASGWRELLMLELRAGVEKVLACLLSSTLTQHLVTCMEVSPEYSELSALAFMLESVHATQYDVFGYR